MSRSLICFLMVAWLTPGAPCAQNAPWPVPLFPRPKAVNWLGPAVALPTGKVAIVFGAKASEPEQYAAETLRKTVKKRFGRDWPMLRETDNLKPYSTLIILGQRSTSKLVDRICRGWKLWLGPDTPGHDGYIIHIGQFEHRTVALVGGSEPRGVVYGQDTLFQMLRKQGAGMVVYPAAIRDWPSIPWRGRPHSSVAGYERPNTYDSFAQARVNWIDLRYGGTIYGTPPGAKLDLDKIKNVIKEGHRRGFFIFGTVDCAVGKEKYDDVIKTFEEYINLGADGMYISIDDPGADSRVGTSIELLQRIVELGKKHGITGSKLAMVPGKESYKEIDTATNHKVGHTPGMERVLLFQTQPPSAENLQKTYDCGFKIPPAWWLNWPRPRGGFTHNGNASRRENGYPYMYLSPLTEGWWNPTWEQIRNAGTQCSGVMPWGASIWGNEYVAGVLNMWAWDPAQHDWKEERTRIYDIVFGPDMVEYTFQFDDLLQKVLAMFITAPDAAGSKGGPQFSWPPVLRNPSDRAKVNEILASMEAPLQKIEAGAAKGSLLADTDLTTHYLEPMRYEYETAKIDANLPFPEDWWSAHEQRVLMAVRAGNLEQARQWQDEARDRAMREARHVDEVLQPRVTDVDHEKLWAAKWPAVGEAHYVNRPVSFKGDLSDPAWADVPKMDHFGTGGAYPDPEDQTDAQVLYDDDALYVGLTCHESTMNKLAVLRTARDSDVWEDDSVEVFINTDCLLYPNYQLAANVNGVQFDGWEPMGGPFDNKWNGDWEVKTARAADRWTIEFKIPFKTLGVEQSPRGRLWMCNFARNDHANNTLQTRGYYESLTTSYGSEPLGSNHDVRKFRPIWFK